MVKNPELGYSFPWYQVSGIETWPSYGWGYILIYRKKRR